MADIFSTIGRVVQTFSAAPQGVSGRIWDELRPWLARLVVNAAPKWLPRLSWGFACSVPTPHGQPCPRPAVAACDVCGEPCCLDHARIDAFGDAICYRCCIEAIRTRQARGGAPPPPRADEAPPPGPRATGPSPAEVTWARKLLAVKSTATWEEIRKAHRRLSAKWHPDKHAGDGYAAAEAKFKEVQRALDILDKERQRQQAA